MLRIHLDKRTACALRYFSLSTFHAVLSTCVEPQKQEHARARGMMDGIVIRQNTTPRQDQGHTANVTHYI